MTDNRQMLIDVILCTLDSEHKLKECLDALTAEIPVRRIILVDGGSKDTTLDIARQYDQVDIYTRPELNRGQALQFAFAQVQCGKAAFVADYEVQL